MNKIRIVMDGPGRGHVYVDDREIHYVERIAFRARAGQANRVCLWLFASDVEIEAPAQVERVTRIVGCTCDFQYVADCPRHGHLA